MRKPGRPSLPPLTGRFRKGQSGNPKGRPKAERPGPTSAFDIVIEKTLTTVRNGVPREMTVDEALQHRTYQDALGGNRMAQREILKMILKREKALATRDAQRKNHVESRLEPADPANADEALQILGIASIDAGREQRTGDRDPLLLEPWAVEAALGRRRGVKPLTAREISEIRRCTRDSVKLRWPRGAYE